MKKVLLFALVMLVSIAFVGAGFAQEKAKAPEKAKPAAEKPAVEKPAPAKEEKPAEAKEPEKAAEKPKPKPIPGFVGKVTVTDSVFKTVTVQRGKDSVAFDVSDAKLKGYKNLDQITVGDKVAVQYDKKGAMTVLKIAGAKKAKAAKKEGMEKPKKEKKEGAAEEQKPAAEKKPAKKVKKDEKKEEKKEEKK